MPRGKPFVCWIGKGNSTTLLIGDEVCLRKRNKEDVIGKFGCSRHNGIYPYFVKVGKVKHQVASIHELIPINELERIE